MAKQKQLFGWREEESQEDTTDYEQGEQKFWFIPVTQCQIISYPFQTSDK